LRKGFMALRSAGNRAGEGKEGEKTGGGFGGIAINPA
jgi:hypothetical protein